MDRTPGGGWRQRLPALNHVDAPPGLRTTAEGITAPGRPASPWFRGCRIAPRDAGGPITAADPDLLATAGRFGLTVH